MMCLLQASMRTQFSTRVFRSRPAVALWRRLLRRGGFTLIELLIVIAIIGILISLLLPAVQSIRESARRTQCRNNLKQLGLALHGYHESHQRFPPAMEFPDGEYSGLSAEFGPNWIISILPHMEAQNLHDQFDFTVSIAHDNNRAARSSRPSWALCPTDIGSETPCSLYGGDWARGNYAANGCLRVLNNSDGPNSQYWGQEPHYRGVMGSNTALTMAHILDGTPQTIMVTEVRIGLADIDLRGTWAMGAPGASAIWGSSDGDGHGPNDCTPQADNLHNWTDVVNAVGLQRLLDECMRPGQSHRNQALPRSRHLDGVFACMADGSVRMISNEVERSAQWTVNVEDFRVWERLNASNDGLGQITEEF